MSDRDWTVTFPPRGGLHNGQMTSRTRRNAEALAVSRSRQYPEEEVRILDPEGVTVATYVNGRSLTTEELLHRRLHEGPPIAGRVRADEED